MRAGILILLCLLLCSCGPDVLIRADKPMALAEVRRRGETDFPFPVSAHDIQYAIFQDWQAAEYLVRFDAPPSDCEATINHVLAWHKPQMRSLETYRPHPFAGSIESSSHLRPAAWFDGTVIQRGLYVGEDSSHLPNIWVDLNAGRFYYRSSD